MNTTNELAAKAAEAAELRAALAEYERSTRPASPPLPLPPGITSADTQRAQDGANQAYTAAIMAKPTGKLTHDEREYLRAHVNHALRALGNS
jgi:hypothetical protein